MTQHKPVLPEEVIGYLSPKSPGIYVDATVGGGGHAERLLEESSPEGRLIGIDIDPYMIGVAGSRLKKFGDRYILIEDNFINLGEILSGQDVTSVSGIVFDLGVATEHFMLPERGFSFFREGPLDMRLDPGGKLTAEHIVNKWKPQDLISILYQYGQERHAKKITRYIVAERNKRKIATTTQLAGIVARAFRGGRIHPATKTFQALRIAVNDELKNLREALPVAIGLLKPGGRLCVISFHSLEDRIVKNTFRSTAGIKIITKKPVVPTKAEIEANPRSRSAKLRVAEKI